MGLRAAVAAASVVRARVIFFCRAGMRAFLAAGVMAGSASSPASSRSAAASVFSASRTAAFAVAGGVADQLGVHLDAGGVVADLVYSVVVAGVLEEVLLPATGTSASPGCRAGAVVGGEDLQHRPAVLEQGELPGFAVLLELHFLLSPGDLAGLAAR